MKEQVVIWKNLKGAGFKWFVSLHEIETIKKEVVARGFEVVYAGALTPDLDAKYPEAA